MKRYLITAIFIAAILGCSKKRTQGEQGKPFSNVSELPAEQKPHAAPEKIGIREVAKSKLQRFDFDTPGVLEDSIATLLQLTRDLEVEEQLSHAEALNELFITLTDNRPAETPLPIKGLFMRELLVDPDGIASILGGLPAGEFRRFCIGFIRGPNVPRQQLAGIYLAMPESADRSVIADLLVAHTFSEQGVDPALTFIHSLTSPYEREHALDALANSISSAYQFRGKITPSDDLAKVKEFAKSVGQDYPVRTLDKLRVQEVK